MHSQAHERPVLVDLDEATCWELMETAGIGRLVWVDADGLVRTTGGVTVAVVGIPGAVVVQTDDALLVTTVEHAQRVKEVPAALAASGRTDLV